MDRNTGYFLGIEFVSFKLLSFLSKSLKNLVILFMFIQAIGNMIS